VTMATLPTNLFMPRFCGGGAGAVSGSPAGWKCPDDMRLTSGLLVIA
jgi:hypothetical protein